MRDNTPKPNVFAIELRTVNEGFYRFYSLTDTEWKKAFRFLLKSRNDDAMTKEPDVKVAVFLDNSNNITYVRLKESKFKEINRMMQEENGFDLASAHHPDLSIAPEAMIMLINSIVI